jgi:hypothetical protein
MPPGTAAMMSGTTSWRGGVPGCALATRVVLAGAEEAASPHGPGVVPGSGITCEPAIGRLTAIAAASALVFPGALAFPGLAPPAPP